MRLVVTGIGMVTALGYGRAGSCAAMRAGLSSARELPGVMVADGDGEVVSARGHPIPGFAEGFFQAGAWVRLASGALEDLLHEGGAPLLPASAWSRTGVIALTPLLDPERFMWPIDQQPDALTAFFTAPLRELMGLPVAPENLQAVAAGHSGLGVALQRAQKLIAARQVDRVVLVGADSYLDGLSLGWLLQHERMKGAEAPTGLLPGQAGACLLVESDAAARARGTSLWGQLAAVSVKAPPPEEPSDLMAWGRLLAEAVTEVLTAARAKTPFRGELVLDLNGESWRAQVWGMAQVLLAHQIDFDACHALLPCEALGEVGAASGGVGAGLALTGFWEREAMHEEALVCCVSEAGHVAAVLLRRAGPVPEVHGRS
jgi:3-oxoacyl-[acyl-carrier-protein] synthase I